MGREKVSRVRRGRGECLRRSSWSRWSKVWCSVRGGEAPGGQRQVLWVSHGELLVCRGGRYAWVCSVDAQEARNSIRKCKMSENCVQYLWNASERHSIPSTTHFPPKSVDIGSIWSGLSAATGPACVHAIHFGKMPAEHTVVRAQHCRASFIPGSS